MRPTDKDPKIQWPVVPECEECRKIWQDAESLFRIVAVLASKEGNAAAEEQWFGSIKRSFDHASGPKWLAEMLSYLTPVEVDGRLHLQVHPAKVAKAMTVLRRTIRGLVHWHKLGTAIPDKRVFADVYRVPFAPEYHDRFTEVILDEDFCRYYYADLRADGEGYHSVWVIQFYRRGTFLGIVSALENGFPWDSEAGH